MDKPVIKMEKGNVSVLLNIGSLTGIQKEAGHHIKVMTGEPLQFRFPAGYEEYLQKLVGSEFPIAPTAGKVYDVSIEVSLRFSQDQLKGIWSKYDKKERGETPTFG